MNGRPEKIVEYFTVQSESVENIDLLVNRLLKKDVGWKPFGSLIVSGGTFVQPLVRIKI